MQDLNNVQVINLESDLDMGVLFGARGSQDLTNYINSRDPGTSLFQDELGGLASYRQRFLDTLVTPVQRTNEQVEGLIGRYIEYRNPYEYESQGVHPALDLADLRNIPEWMILPILTYDPVYELFRDGRVIGYGFSIPTVKSWKPMYDRVIHNAGTVHPNSSEYFDDENDDDFTTDVWSSDIEFSEEELDAIYDTLDYVDMLIRTTLIDPTDPDSIRG